MSFRTIHSLQRLSSFEFHTYTYCFLLFFYMYPQIIWSVWQLTASTFSEENLHAKIMGFWKMLLLGTMNYKLRIQSLQAYPCPALWGRQNTEYPSSFLVTAGRPSLLWLWWCSKGEVRPVEEDKTPGETSFFTLPLVLALVIPHPCCTPILSLALSSHSEP